MRGRDFRQALVPIAAIAIVQPYASAHAEDYLTAEQAQKLLLPDADGFSELTVSVTDEQLDRIRELSGVRQRSKLPRIWKATRKTKPVGWFYVDEVVGKHEFITHATAISMDGRVLGVEILSYRETHGGQVQRLSWRQRFLGKTLADPLKLDVDIPNITGATLSCRNLTDGVKRLLAFQKVVLDVTQTRTPSGF